MGTRLRRADLKTSHQDGGGDAFRHEALFYQGLDGFVLGAVPFISQGLELGEPVLVLAPPDRLEAVREVLNGAADEIHLEDMHAVGKNPGAIISRWREFLRAHPCGRVRGIGEPIWAGRSPEELVECQRHEALINVAFAGQPGTVMCPYDTQALAPEILDEAERSHPVVVQAGASTASLSYEGVPAIAQPFGRPLPPPGTRPEAVDFDGSTLATVRKLLLDHARRFGLAEDRIGALQVAVTELASNSIRHGGGRGSLALWTDGDVLYCEVSDPGRICDPLAGRQLPTSGEISGRGLWLVNQLCDLVQLRSSDAGSVVRVQMRR